MPGDVLCPECLSSVACDCEMVQRLRKKASKYANGHAAREALLDVADALEERTKDES